MNNVLTGLEKNQCIHNGTPCARCTILPSPICCSLCSPTHPIWRLLTLADELSETTINLRASNVNTNYKMTPRDDAFRHALHMFRSEEMAKRFGRVHLVNLGPGDIMGNSVLMRILACALASKIHSIEALDHETKWGLTQELGQHVLTLIDK
ncbi:hypothetical protein L227DRAFT_493725 [Lentinus tigrinus ALCF2SS1-6]|uniref:Uncharacterized protein n=1 Tax=Lentinus tigrinus ALCF2SS1-6 TaxID=1328759 RepID=A0A5C2SP46_9APHY|nr:hypothetical protein L227DRAFT_493725 [Lentinus tigrinus ALCF2SS1-6]